MATVCRDHGALRIVVRWLDEALQESGAIHAERPRSSQEKTSEVFRDAKAIAGAGPEEVLMLSWVEWPDEDAHDAEWPWLSPTLGFSSVTTTG